MTTPAKIAQTDEERQAALAPPPAISAQFAHQLQLSGVDLARVRVPAVPFHWKVSWDELCTLTTRDAKTMSSPLCLVTKIVDMPDAASDFDDYVGMIRVEFVTEDMEKLFITHSRCYADSGEYLPLTEFMKAQEPPFVVRFGYIETRKVGRHVVRALPVDIQLS